MPAGSRKRAREEEEEDGQSLPGEGRSGSREAGGSEARDDGSSEGPVPQQPSGGVATVGEASSSDVLAVHHPHAIIANPVQVHVQDCHTIPSVCLSVCLSVLPPYLLVYLSVHPSVCLSHPLLCSPPISYLSSILSLAAEEESGHEAHPECSVGAGRHCARLRSGQDCLCYVPQVSGSVDATDRL